MRIFPGIFASVFLLAGCQSLQSDNTGKGALSIPTKGNVRLVTTALENSATRQHFKWSVIGERNWMEAKASNGVLSLAKTYPINSPTQRGGCNIWEVDLTLEAKAETVAWEARLHGSDGTTVKEKGTVSLSGQKLTDVFQVRQAQSTVTGLPADVPLARLGDKEFRLQISDK